PQAFVVETNKVASGKQAVAAVGQFVNNGAYAFPIIGYMPSPGEKIDIQADIARTVSTGGKAVYAIDIYNENSDSMARFGLMDDGGIIKEFANGDEDNQPAIFDTVLPNTFVHFEMILDFDSQTSQLFIDGKSAQNYVPMAFLQSSVALGAAALQIGAVSGQN